MERTCSADCACFCSASCSFFCASSPCFCASCSRLRLTADGCLKPCLHSREEIHLRGLHGSELAWAIKLAIAHKPREHCPLSATERSNAKRDMNRIGG